MSTWQLATKSLLHFWRTNLALLAGIAIATAVLTGALIVGDSVRESLRRLTRERLGRIDEILIGQQFFDESLASSLAEAMPETYSDAVPAILVNQATIETSGKEAKQRAQSVTILGIPDSFWTLDVTGLERDLAPQQPSTDQIVINQSLADELKVQVGDKLILRIGKTSGIAADSPLARKEDLVETMVDLEVIQIIPAEGLGRFTLQASQQIPANAFLNLATLQEGLDQEGKINSIFVGSADPQRIASGGNFHDLQNTLKPTLADLGLSLSTVKLEYQQEEDSPANASPQSVLEYQTLINDRMIFTSEQSEAIEKAARDVPLQPLSTYLTTKLQRLDAAQQPTGDIVAYSTITAVDSNAAMGPLVDAANDPISLSDNEIALNSWTAEAMDAKLGETIRVTYFLPESAHRDPVEVTEDFLLKSIIPITTPDRPFSRRRDAVFIAPPTLANDPNLTPKVEGITDAESIDRWDAPFPMDRSLITGRDDDYWQYYRTTPKAFISAAAGKRLWQSRFGHYTSYRTAISEDTPALDPEQLQAKLAADAEAFNFRWIRAKREGRDAAKGTTPFDVLFLGFSQFIIAAALILVALLLRLNLEQRARQIGLLQAVGFNWKRTQTALLYEMTLLIVLGGILGGALGIAYGRFMVTGLQTWWVDAIVTPFMKLWVTPTSIFMGFTLGAIAAFATIWFTLRGFRKIAPTQLITGSTTTANASTGRTTSGWMRWIPAPLLLAAVLLGLTAPTQPPASQGGLFFGSGISLLAALLLMLANALRRRGELDSPGYLDQASLAFRNLTRNPTRSTLTIGLVAAACFLIIAISAFQLSPNEGGTGGIEYVGTSDQPLFDAEVTLQSDGESADSIAMIGLRMQDGDDASCRNLFQSQRPRLIGVTPDFIERMKTNESMQWAGSEAVEPADVACPWRLLAPGSAEADAGPSDVIPVVLDKNTAMYGMQIYGGPGTTFERDYGDAGKLKFRIVGFLAGSIFQGNLLVPEDRLLENFPLTSGYRYFVADTTEADASVLEDRFSDEGLDLTSTEALLTELLAVQNTYLSTFQSLGGLGLLLGTLGLAAVQVRNVVQRRREFALMRAIGFRQQQLSGLILREHCLLLFGGLAVGTIAALVVVLPHWLFGGASIPVISLATTLALVILVGVISGLFAQSSLQSSTLLTALRDD